MKHAPYFFTALIVAGVTLGAATRIDPGSPEQSRVRQHLLGAERELLQRDVSSLTEAQRAARARNIHTLREYRINGVFPHNHDYPGIRVPYFRDAHGTLCAMAYLIARSENSDLV